MESIIAAILSGVVTLIGVLIANSRSNAVMEYKIEELTREVRNHNGFHPERHSGVEPQNVRHRST